MHCNALFTVLSRLVCWVYCEWSGLCTLYNALCNVLSKVVWLLLSVLPEVWSVYCLQCIVYCTIKVGLTIADLYCQKSGLCTVYSSLFTALSRVYVLFTMHCLLYYQGWFDYSDLYCQKSGLCTVYSALFTALARVYYVLFTMHCLLYYQGRFDYWWFVLPEVWSVYCLQCFV